jgi:hypothetical protein
MGESFNGQTIRSPIIPTTYAHHASQLIHGITKKMLLAIIVLGPLFFLSIVDALRLLGIKNIIGDQLLDNTMVIFSACLLVVMVFLCNSLLRSRKILNQWADVFARNSIIAGMNISMSHLSKEDALIAIAETVEEIGQPLRRYFSEGKDLKKFIDVPRGKNLVFDVLLDKEIDGIPDDLKKVLREYGSVIIKVEGGQVDSDKVRIFSKTLFHYIKETGNTVALPILIGEDVSDSAYNFVNTSHDQVIKRIVLVEESLVQLQLD